MTATIQPVLDHVVINVLGELDEASTIWNKLGFDLTVRGHHSMGTSNHLSIFGENYLELLGFEPGNEKKRPDIVNAPKGLTGLVFKTTDSTALYDHIQGAGLKVEPIAEFHRPVDLPEGTKDARFKTVRIGADLVKNGRTFFCHHFTPELVWRDEWRAHPNGVTDLTGFIVASPNPVETVKLYETLFGPGLVVEEIRGGVAFQAGRPKVQSVTPAVAAERFGAVETTTDGSERMVALQLATRSIDALQALLDKNGVPFKVLEDGSVLVAASDAYRVALQFVPAAP